MFFLPCESVAEVKEEGFRLQTSDFRKRKKEDLFLKPFNVFSTLEDGVAEGGERLPEADIAAPFRRKG